MIFLWQAHLEDLVDKDAMEKSDAAREAFLAELALDDKKNINRGVDHSKQTQEKSKDKKRSKDYRKAKDLKVLTVSGVVLFLFVRVTVTRHFYDMVLILWPSFFFFFFSRLLVTTNSVSFMRKQQNKGKSQHVHIVCDL